MQDISNSISFFILQSNVITLTWPQLGMIIIGFILIAFFLRVISVKKYQKQIDDLLQQRMSELKSNEKIQEEIIDMETKMDRYKNRIGDLEEALQKADDEINKLKSKQ